MGHGFSRIERIHADYFGSIGCESVESVLLSRKSFASWKRFLPRTMATSVHVHVHDHVNVHELRPRLTLGAEVVVDVVVDVHVDVNGFFICDTAAPCESVSYAEFHVNQSVPVFTKRRTENTSAAAGEFQVSSNARRGI